MSYVWYDDILKGRHLWLNHHPLDLLDTCIYESLWFRPGTFTVTISLGDVSGGRSWWTQTTLRNLMLPWRHNQYLYPCYRALSTVNPPPPSPSLLHTHVLPGDKLPPRCCSVLQQHLSWETFTYQHQSFMKEAWNSNMLTSHWPAKHGTNAEWVRQHGSLPLVGIVCTWGPIYVVPPHTGRKKNTSLNAGYWKVKQ